MMMEAVHTSETSVNFNVTARRYIPEDYKLHARYRENLKSHIINQWKAVVNTILNLPSGSIKGRSFLLLLTVILSRRTLLYAVAATATTTTTTSTTTTTTTTTTTAAAATTWLYRC
jgi:hypothetical protein